MNGFSAAVSLKSEVIYPGHWRIIEKLNIRRGRNQPAIHLKKVYHENQGTQLLDHLQTLRKQYTNFTVKNGIGYIGCVSGDIYPELEHIRNSINKFYVKRTAPSDIEYYA